MGASHDVDSELARMKAETRPGQRAAADGGGRERHQAGTASADGQAARRHRPLSPLRQPSSRRLVTGMIVRILGEGQLRIDDSAASELNALDQSWRRRSSATTRRLSGRPSTTLLARVRAIGRPVEPPSSSRPS